MFRKIFCAFPLVVATLFAFSQEQAVPTHAFLVVSKVLSPADSNLVKELYFDGLHEKLLENPKGAAENFKKIIRLDAGNDAAIYELASIEHDNANDKEAERLIRNAVTLRPENQWYWLLLADIYKKTNKLDELVLVFSELIKLSPEVQQFYFDKANCLLLLNRVDEAVVMYHEIEKNFGESDDLSSALQYAFLQQGKPDKAKDQLLKQIQSNPNDLHNYLFLADIYSKEGDIKESVSILQKAKKIDPQNALIRLSLANNYQAMNLLDDAFIELKVAFEDANLNVDKKVQIVLSFFPQFSDAKARAYADELASILARVHSDDPKAFAVYGDVLFQEQKYTEATDAYKKALKLNDQVYQIWEQLVRIEISQGDFLEAIKDGDAALSIFPNQAALYMYTGMAYAQTQNHKKAISYLNIAASLEQEDKEAIGQIFSALGDSYNALKQYKESDSAYDKALEVNPGNSYTLNNYAYYLSLRGESLDKAETMSKRSNELNPNNASSEDTYAWILFHLTKYQEAKVWIEKALFDNKQIESVVQIDHYGDILFLLGDKEKALEQWTKAKIMGLKSEKLDQKIKEKRYVK